MRIIMPLVAIILIAAAWAAALGLAVVSEQTVNNYEQRGRSSLVRITP
jgi:hypothetical protein